jgi:hypothetical protein
MIIVKISGGLGNQLLQYAFAKSLEQRRKIQVKIDSCGYQMSIKNITPRYFLLDKFNISLEIATRDDFHKIGMPYPLDRSLGENIYRIIFKIKECLRPTQRKKIIIERGIDYNESMLESPDNSYISGIWTSPKYFENIKDIITKNIKTDFPFSDKCQKILAKIKETNSASIHIRRGDYLKYTNKVVLLAEDYYKEATNILIKKEKNPNFFVFSDDIEYVQKNYAKIFGAETVYVSSQGIADYEELMLMSFCKHNITANSTFSWWGAWLNQNPNKTVIAPKKYRNDNRNFSDFFPKEWLTI